MYSTDAHHTVSGTLQLQLWETAKTNVTIAIITMSSSASTILKSTRSVLIHKRVFVSVQGSRFVNLEKLQEYINNLTIHAAQCGGDILLAGEKRDGLAAIISTKCSKCSCTITLETSRKVKGPRGYHRWECNLAAVWGQMSTSVGHSKLCETMGVLDVPVMSA